MCANLLATCWQLAAERKTLEPLRILPHRFLPQAVVLPSSGTRNSQLISMMPMTQVVCCLTPLLAKHMPWMLEFTKERGTSLAKALEARWNLRVQLEDCALGNTHRVCPNKNNPKTSCKRVLCAYNNGLAAKSLATAPRDIRGRDAKCQILKSVCRQRQHTKCSKTRATTHFDRKTCAHSRFDL